MKIKGKRVKDKLSEKTVSIKKSQDSWKLYNTGNSSIGITIYLMFQNQELHK